MVSEDLFISVVQCSAQFSHKVCKVAAVVGKRLNHKTKNVRMDLEIIITSISTLYIASLLRHRRQSDFVSDGVYGNKIVCQEHYPIHM